MNVDEYKAKQERKQEAYQRLAKKNKVEAEKTLEHSNKLADLIPMGQPILTDHHSYKSDISFRARIDRTRRKALELADKADYYNNKVQNIVNPKAISSDDPEAIQKLQAEIEELEKTKLNYDRKTYKINPQAKYFENGSEHHRKLELESLTRRIRDKKKRIEQLKSISNIKEESKVINGITLTIDTHDNRVKLFFPSIPSEEIRTELKRNGFHWSPYNKAWQRMINNTAIYQAERIIEGFKQ